MVSISVVQERNKTALLSLCKQRIHISVPMSTGLIGRPAQGVPSIGKRRVLREISSFRNVSIGQCGSSGCTLSDGKPNTNNVNINNTIIIHGGLQHISAEKVI